MNALLVAARFAHLLAAILLFGQLVFAVTVARGAMRADRQRNALDWVRLWRRQRAIVDWSFAISIVSAAAWFIAEAVLMSGSPLAELFGHDTLGIVAAKTFFGRVWIARAVIAVILFALIAIDARAKSARVHSPAIIGAMLLAGAYLATLSLAGHAAAGEAPDRYGRVAVDAIHSLAAGAWLGALPGLVLLLIDARRTSADTSVDVGAVAARRFSMLGIASVGALVVTGIVNAWFLVGDIPALFGTEYGRLLIAKILLFLAMLTLAATNRMRLTPRVTARDLVAMRALSRNAALEVALGIGVVAIVGTLGITVPAAHSPTIWPFSFTLHIESAPPYVSLVRAYPTTYATSPLRYTTAAIAQGAAVYAQNCAQCHAPHADHEAPTHMQHEAPDLSDHGTHHPPGDLFWWIAHGIAGTSMPAFSPRLSDTAIWSTIEFIHAHAQANEARAMTSSVEPWRPIVAPDFTFETAGRPQQSLRDERRRHAVLLVLYTLPQSLERLRSLDAENTALDNANVRIIAVPFKPDGFDSKLPSFAALAGAGVGAVYLMFASPDEAGTTPAHVEFLIDRHGYLRARWLGVPGDGAQRNAEVLAQAALLKAEPERAPPPETHMH